MPRCHLVKCGKVAERREEKELKTSRVKVLIFSGYFFLISIDLYYLNAKGPVTNVRFLKPLELLTQRLKNRQNWAF